jgi:hypothetical protein
MGSGDTFATDIPEQLQIINVKEADWSSHKVNYIRQMLKHNDQCTGFAYMEETLSYPALQGYYDVDSGKLLCLLTATDEQGSTCSAHLIRLHTIQE